MTSRKKNLFLIQITIFLVAIALIYDTYRDKNIEKKLFVPIRAETDSEINVFTDIKYSGSIFRNRRAAEKITYQSEDQSHFYIPINRLQPFFGFPMRNKSRKWFAINWCPIGFYHLLTANA